MLRSDERTDSELPEPEELWPSWRDIDAAEEQRHYATAVFLCREYLKREPNSGIAWGTLGWLLYEMARYEEARAALEEALKHPPLLPSLPDFRWTYPLYKMGHLYRARGRYAEAAVWYHRGIELEPNDATGYIFLGAVLAKSGDFAGAEEQHRKAIRCEDGCIDEAYLNLGLVLRAQERFSEAAECLRKSLELDTDGDADGGTRAALEDVERMLRFTRGKLGDNSNAG